VAASPPARAPVVVGVGHASLDHVFELERLPAAAVKVPAQAYRMQVGGMTANAAVAAARLGARVRLAAPLGDDGWADVFRLHFLKQGVDAHGLVVVPGAQSSVAAVLVDSDGQRLIVGHRGDATWRAPALAEGVLDGADVLLTDPRCPGWCRTALGWARARGVTSVLDADTAPPDDLRAAVALADWAVFSEPGLAAFSGPGVAQDEALGQAIAGGARHAVVTLGERGLLWKPARGALHRVPAFEVPHVVDTTAAGDVFHGALGCALGRGMPSEQALRFASAAAALKCTRGGGALAAPMLEDVERALAAR
jgi:sulfofructose kinase